MTDAQRLEAELEHLVNLCADPYRDYWIRYAWSKANAMAEREPNVFGPLPGMLKERMTANVEKDSE